MDASELEGLREATEEVESVERMRQKSREGETQSALVKQHLA